MENLIDLLHKGSYSCVVGNQQGVFIYTRRGVADLYELYQNDPEKLLNANIADKVVGKAAATLMVLGKIKNVYADVISTPALDILRQFGVTVDYAIEVPFIKNREKSGICPLETLCSNCKSIKEVMFVIKDFMYHCK